MERIALRIRLDTASKAVTNYTRDLTRALRRKEKTASVQVLELAVRDGVPLTLVWSEVFIPALTELGKLWLSGRLSERQFDRISRLACRVETEFRSRTSQQGLFEDLLFEEGKTYCSRRASGSPTKRKRLRQNLACSPSGMVQM
ncbi:MAG: hypothetical protein M1358_07440 [Chloroflexi bacterium]|nr:hypothetical protein [Chloroflexota bacterium]